MKYVVLARGQIIIVIFSCALRGPDSAMQRNAFTRICIANEPATRWAGKRSFLLASMSICNARGELKAEKISPSGLSKTNLDVHHPWRIWGGGNTLFSILGAIHRPAPHPLESTNAQPIAATATHSEKNRKIFSTGKNFYDITKWNCLKRALKIIY